MGWVIEVGESKVERIEKKNEMQWLDWDARVPVVGASTVGAAPRCCSNYIFILDLTPGFNRLGKYNCKTRWETFKFWEFDAPNIRGLTVYQAINRDLGRWCADKDVELGPNVSTPVLSQAQHKNNFLMWYTHTS